jgi:PhnB protein
MTTRLNPYLGFRSEARAAMEFYRGVFGGELTFSTFGEMGMTDDPDGRDKIMHAQLETPGGLVLMGADTPASMPYTRGDDFSVSLSGGPEDDAELRRFWDGLAEGATVVEPLAVAPWGDAFGMLRDRFGVGWMVNIAGAAA